jgi:hypothetical protein
VLFLYGSIWGAGVLGCWGAGVLDGAGWGWMGLDGWGDKGGIGAERTERAFLARLWSLEGYGTKKAPGA